VKRSGVRRLLVVASRDADRAALAAPLAKHWSVREVSLERLSDAGALHDPTVVVALLRGVGEAEALDAVAANADARLVLLSADVLDTRLERLLERLGPEAWLAHPAPAAALRRAVEQALARLPDGRGARRDQRRAQALLGVSSAIRDLLEQVRRIAPSDMPVLVCGETGSGKELVARAVHEQSRRARGPFVAVNCGALPDTLLESELFGFARGAFTGAVQARQGLFEQADGGTLFLDEIGDTSPGMQAKLLRVLEARAVRPLGAEGERPIDVRIVSATHRDLDAGVRDGRFRQDLLFRLNAATLAVPPLRRRRVDIPFLAQHFAEELGDAHARRIVLGEDFLEALGRHGFPGNVRELRNAVERAIALAGTSDEIGAAHLAFGGEFPATAAAPGTLRERVEQLEGELIRAALRRHAGNRTHVAAALGLSRPGLRQKMRRLGLADDDARD
jgi:transcriptional regulator with PAS, ATPase and Fis domain